MKTIDILTLISMFLSPVIAVVITLWWTKRDGKKVQKMNLFMTLLAHRKSKPASNEYVNALNTIDVVFYNNQKVISAWKELFNSYNAIPFNMQTSEKRLLDLLDTMAKSLGYNNIKQTTFDDFYFPVSHGNKDNFQNELNTEILRVLKNSESFGINIQAPSQDNPHT